MHFVHPTLVTGETIAALATPPGEGGIAVIRVSGDQAVEIVNKIFSGPVDRYKTHSAHYGQIRDQAGEPVDDVLVIPMLGKRSFAGEDTVEIHCHGSMIIARRILDLCMEVGCRPAQPGEFSFRAFMNGKMDLAQAEAVQQVISSQNERAANVASLQLQGKLSAKVSDLQRKLSHIAAILEAWVDFPEEGLEFASQDEVCQELESVARAIASLLSTYREGRILHDGVSLCLIGKPNVGKSSLLNLLVEKERAIVTNVPGTTRDLVEEKFTLNGLQIRLVDTAGIRQTEEVIEAEGIRRSLAMTEEADIILFVLDAARGFEDEDKVLLEKISLDKTLLIWNKTDLPHKKPLPMLPSGDALEVSAKRQEGLEELKTAIDRKIWGEGKNSSEGIVLTQGRHRKALMEAERLCREVAEGIRGGQSPEFLVFDLREALKSLGLILGTDVSEDILNEIFSTFCVGK